MSWESNKENNHGRTGRVSRGIEFVDEDESYARDCASCEGDLNSMGFSGFGFSILTRARTRCRIREESVNGRVE